MGTLNIMGISMLSMEALQESQIKLLRCKSDLRFLCFFVNFEDKLLHNAYNYRDEKGLVLITCRPAKVHLLWQGGSCRFSHVYIHDSASSGLGACSAYAGVLSTLLLLPLTGNQVIMWPILLVIVITWKQCKQPSNSLLGNVHFYCAQNHQGFSTT